MVLERISQQTPSVDTRIPVPTSNVPPTLIIDCTGKGEDKVALKVIDDAGVDSSSLIANGNANFTCTTLDGTGLGDDKKMLTIKDNAGVTQATIRASGQPTFRAIEVSGTGTGAGTTMFYITGDDGTSNFEVKESGIVTINSTDIAAGTTMLDIQGTGGGGTTLQLTEDGIVKPQSIQFPDATIQTIAAGFGQHSKGEQGPLAMVIDETGFRTLYSDDPGANVVNARNFLFKDDGFFYDFDITLVVGPPEATFTLLMVPQSYNYFNNSSMTSIFGSGTLSINGATPVVLVAVAPSASYYDMLQGGAVTFQQDEVIKVKGTFYSEGLQKPGILDMSYTWYNSTLTPSANFAKLTLRTSSPSTNNSLRSLKFFTNSTSPIVPDRSKFRSSKRLETNVV